jgi:glutamate racemase
MKGGVGMVRKEDFIGVFDSGVGGMSVLRQLVKFLPNERFLYFGDSANAPYGTRPTPEIRDLTMAAAHYLLDRGCKALVVACNTATAAAIRDIREAYPNRIIIGIEPALKVAADHFPGGEIGVMATPATLREEKFDNLLHRFTEKCTVTKLPAPGLVELVERGMAESEETETLLTPLLAPYYGKLDAVVLGCTHYPFAASVIGRLLGENTALLHGGEGTARETRRRLEAAGLLNDGPGEVVIENSTGDENMIALCKKLLYDKL